MGEEQLERQVNIQRLDLERVGRAQVDTAIENGDGALLSDLYLTPIKQQNEIPAGLAYGVVQNPRTVVMLLQLERGYQIAHNRRICFAERNDGGAPANNLVDYTGHCLGPFL